MARARIIFVYAGSVLLFLIILPGAVILTGRLLDCLLHLPRIPWRALIYPLAFLSIFAGLSFVKGAWKSLLHLGKGHPQEAFGVPLLPPTQQLVIDGPYRYTRNPMALGFLLYLIGSILLFRSLSALILLYPLVCAVAVLYLKKIEEPHLIRRFGEEYLEYRNRISFLLPSVPH